MRKFILLALLAIITLGVIGFFLTLDHAAQTSTDSIVQQNGVSYEVPNRPAFDRIDIPNNIDEMICLLGHPIFVTNWDLDPNTRFVFFKGPFKDADATAPNGRTYLYMYQSIKSLKSKQNSGAMFMDSIDEHLTQILPDERTQFLIPRFKGVPDRLDQLTKLLGKWDIEYKKKDPDRLRIVYDKNMCLGKQLLIGAYFDVVGNRIVNTRGFTNREKLQWVMENRKKQKADEKPIKYTQHIPAEGTAKHIVTQLVLLREAGKTTEALGLLSKKQTGEFIRNEITRQAAPNSSIDMDSFTYQATKYTRNSAYISVEYYLKNGNLINTKHKLILERDRWRIMY